MDYNHLYKKYKAKYLALKNQLQIGGKKFKPACTGKPNNQDPNEPDYDAVQCKNTPVIGKDGKLYLSIQNKKAEYVWKLIKDMVETKSPEEYYAQFPNIEIKYDIEPTIDKLVKAKEDLEAENIYLLSVRWTGVWDFVDYAWDDAIMALKNSPKIYEILDLEPKQRNNYFVVKNEIFKKISFVFVSSYAMFWARVNGDLFFQFNIMRKDKKKIINTFKQYFGNKFQWMGKTKDAIIIKITDKL